MFFLFASSVFETNQNWGAITAIQKSSINVWKFNEFCWDVCHIVRQKLAKLFAAFRRRRAARAGARGGAKPGRRAGGPPRRRAGAQQRRRRFFTFITGVLVVLVLRRIKHPLLSSLRLFFRKCPAHLLQEFSVFFGTDYDLIAFSSRSLNICEISMQIRGSLTKNQYVRKSASAHETSQDHVKFRWYRAKGLNNKLKSGTIQGSSCRARRAFSKSALLAKGNVDIAENKSRKGFWSRRFARTSVIREWSGNR